MAIRIKDWKIKIAKDGTPILIAGYSFRGDNLVTLKAEEIRIDNAGITYSQENKAGVVCEYECRFEDMDRKPTITSVSKLKEIGIISVDKLPRHLLSFVYEFVSGVLLTANPNIRYAEMFDADVLVWEYKDSCKDIENLSLSYLERVILNRCS